MGLLFAARIVTAMKLRLTKAFLNAVCVKRSINNMGYISGEYSQPNPSPKKKASGKEGKSKKVNPAASMQFWRKKK